jgi:23S rRNA pseudouridine1911/1915/1917 synthase
VPWRVVPLDRGDAGKRVDRVLLRHLRHERGVSRTRIQQWIEAGRVLVNGVPAPRAAWRLRAGDALRIEMPPAAGRARPVAEAIAVDVVYEDPDLLAVNKPSGLVSHPAYGHPTGTLLNGVLALARRWPEGSKPALIGRLDKHTSGLVLVAKRPDVVPLLQRAMAAGQLDKHYLAVVWGKPSPARGTIDLALDRDPWDRQRVTVTDRGGQPSVTAYQRLASATPLSNQAFSLVRCRLITGRMHQIRVHLAARGWPIVGDPLYGRRAGATVAGHPFSACPAALSFPRQALHAWKLEFRHPVTNEDVSIVAPLPADMRGLCAAIGLPSP